MLLYCCWNGRWCGAALLLEAWAMAQEGVTWSLVSAGLCHAAIYILSCYLVFCAGLGGKRAGMDGDDVVGVDLAGTHNVPSHVLFQCLANVVFRERMFSQLCLHITNANRTKIIAMYFAYQAHRVCTLTCFCCNLLTLYNPSMSTDCIRYASLSIVSESSLSYLLSISRLVYTYTHTYTF